jgi:uncharacterized protein (UPF0261 family)
MAVTVLIIGTMDTKARELNFLRERIESEGVQSVLMDVSCKSKTAKHPFHISCEEVALEAGSDFGQMARLDKNAAVLLMREGATRIVQKMLTKKELHAVIGLGGANGAEISCGVMRTLPIGFPKLMVTCVAAGNVRPYVGTKDILMANSIGDISLNRITKKVIHNAARAIVHMATSEPFLDEEMKPQICMSTFGTTLSCVERAKELLEQKGFEIIELHASGTGGMALEELVRGGEVSGVLDITTSELADDLVGGIYSAGPHRLESASALGIPQVVSLGALDFVNFGPKETVPENFRHRDFFFYTPSITLMRTNREENEILGKSIAQKLNGTMGPAAVIIPKKGFSSLDRRGWKKMTKIDGAVSGEWYDEGIDSALVESIKTHLDQAKVEMVEVDAHINDPEFAHRAVTLLCDMIEVQKG